MRLAGYLGNELEVMVVVQEHSVVCPSDGGDQEVGNRAAMPASLCQISHASDYLLFGCSCHREKSQLAQARVIDLDLLDIAGRVQHLGQCDDANRQPTGFMELSDALPGARIVTTLLPRRLVDQVQAA